MSDDGRHNSVGIPDPVQNSVTARRGVKSTDDGRHQFTTPPPPVTGTALEEQIAAEGAAFEAAHPEMNFMKPGEIFQGERISADVSVHNYDLTTHPLSQIGENDNWQDMTIEEQDWLFRGILGRDPLPGEIAWQTNNGGKHRAKDFIHGAQNSELKLRSDRGEEMAQKMDGYIDDWATQFDDSVFQDIADFTGIKELANPYELAWDVSGMGVVFDDILDIKEIHEGYDMVAPAAAQVVATVVGGMVGGPGGAAAGAAAVGAINAGIYGDIGDMTEAAVISGIGASIGSGIGQAAFRTGVAVHQGDDFETAAVKGALSYAGSYLGDNFDPISSFVSNETLFAAASDYYLTGDAKSAMVVASAGALNQKAQEIATGQTAPDVTPAESFRDWVLEDAKAAREEIVSGIAFTKDIPSNVGEKIRQAVHGNPGIDVQAQAVSDAFALQGISVDEELTDKLQSEVATLAEAL